MAKGQRQESLWKYMTGWPALRKYSVDLAPRVPVLKFSTDRTVFFSNGTEVPPDEISTKGLFLSSFLKLL